MFLIELVIKKIVLSVNIKEGVFVSFYVLYWIIRYWLIYNDRNLLFYSFRGWEVMVKCWYLEWVFLLY